LITVIHGARTGHRDAFNRTEIIDFISTLARAGRTKELTKFSAFKKILLRQGGRVMSGGTMRWTAVTVIVVSGILTAMLTGNGFMDVTGHALMKETCQSVLPTHPFRQSGPVLLVGTMRWTDVTVIVVPGILTAMLTDKLFLDVTGHALMKGTCQSVLHPFRLIGPALILITLRRTAVTVTVVPGILTAILLDKLFMGAQARSIPVSEAMEGTLPASQMPGHALNIITMFWTAVTVNAVSGTLTAMLTGKLSMDVPLVILVLMMG